MKETFKIGIVTEIINNHSGSRAPLELAKELGKLNQDITIYAYSHMLDKRIRTNLENNNVRVITLKNPNIPFFGKYISAFRLFNLLRRKGHQIIIYAGMFPFFVASKLSGIPVIRIYQGTQFNAYLEKKIPGQRIQIHEKIINFVANVYIYIIEYLTNQLSNGIIAISKYAKIEAERLYRKKVNKVIYHGTTYLKAKRTITKKSSVKFISVSRITPYKGFHKIIGALNKLPSKNSISLTIVGSQPKKNYVEYLKKISSIDLNIVIDPQDNELAKYYCQSDVYANADRYLFFGLPICEAAHFRLPTITFDFAAAPELVQHKKTGFVAKNEKQFTAYSQKLISNKKLREKMGTNAQKRSAVLFTWENTANKYLDFFKKTLGE